MLGPMLTGSQKLAPEGLFEGGTLPAGTHLTTLDNGLALIIREDPSAPVVSAQAWCKSGSIDEGRWLGAGLSHLLEHMLFKGTVRRGPGQIDREVQDAGGYMNAYTSFDRTVYYINAPSTAARVAVDILCDIMQHATLPEEEMEKEKQVILREMDMNQDDPSRRSSRRLFESSYVLSPYRYTVIGYPDIFNEVRREDVLAYYREKYAANNVFFVVVGDIKREEVEAWVREGYKDAKARPMAPAYFPAEPTQTSPREVLEEAAVELAHFHMAWHTPDIRHPDAPLLDVLSVVLGGGHSSRMFQAIREKAGLVHSVDAWTYNPGSAGLFGVSGVADAQKFDLAKRAILAEVERVRSEPISAAELAKAMKQFTAATLGSRKTMQGQAQELGGSWLAAHDLDFLKRYLAAVRAATPERLLAAARQWLTETSRTVYGLLPSGSITRRSSAVVKIERSAVELKTLGNGLRVLLREDHRLPFVEMRLVCLGGVLAEEESKGGSTLLMSKLLVKGTKTRSAEAIVSEMESLGGSIDSYGGNNSFGVNAEVMAEDLPTGLDLLADVVLNPVFPQQAIEREKDSQLAALRSQKDHLLQAAAREMRRKLFQGRSYGQDMLGSEASISQLFQADVAASHARLALPNNSVLAVYGDINSASVLAEIERRFGAWQPGAAVVLPEPPQVERQGPERVSTTLPKKQGVLVIGFPGVRLTDPDRFALDLLQESLSDLGSRLFARIREQLGLAYYVGAQHFPGLHPGYFALYAGTTPEKVAGVEHEMFEEVEKLRAHGLTEEEVKRAKAKMLGHRKIARQDLGGCAAANALDELYGLGHAHSEEEERRYEALTREMVHEAIRKYLVPGLAVISVAGAAPDASASAA